MLLTMYTGPICAILAETFPTRIRYSALSVSCGFAVAIFGGFAPYISAFLIRATGDSLAPAYYVILAGVLSLIGTYYVQERAGRPLPEEMATPDISQGRVAL